MHRDRCQCYFVPSNARAAPTISSLCVDISVSVYTCVYACLSVDEQEIKREKPTVSEKDSKSIIEVQRKRQRVCTVIPVTLGLSALYPCCFVSNCLFIC